MNFGHLFAQDSTKVLVSLTKILKLIEQRYDVSFSYIDKDLSDINIVTPKASLSFQDVLRFLKSETNLEFDILDNRFIVISAKTKIDYLSIQSLDEVVIINYLTSGITKNFTNTITVTPEKFGVLPGLLEPDVLQTIQALPGIISVDELVSNINIRGGTHDENLILWDGIKMYQSGHFFGMISAFNPYLTKTINVSKNGTSVKYGDGVSGIIDIQNNNSIDQKFKAGLGANFVGVDGFAKVPLTKKTEVQIAARKSITDWVNTPTYNQYFKRIFEDSNFNINTSGNRSTEDHFNFYDISAKYLYDPTPTDKIRVNFISFFNDLNYSEANNTNEVSSSELMQQSLAFGASYQKRWNKSFQTTAQVYYSTYNLDGNNFDVINNQRLQQENKVQDLGIRLQLTRAVDKHLQLFAGYQYNEVGVTNSEQVSQPNFESFSKHFNRTHAIFGEAEFTSKRKKTYVRIGLRTNFIEQFSLFFTEPRISFSQELNDDFRIEILGEFKSQSISQVIDLQQDFLGIEKRRWLLSDGNDIPLIESQQVSAGLHYNNKQWLVSLEPFL